MAAGKYSFEGYIDFLKDNETDLGRIASYYIMGEKKVTDKAEFLKSHYYAFGTVENIEKFKADLESKTGRETELVHHNSTPNKHRAALSRNEIAMAERYCSEDMELYAAMSS